MNRCQAKGFLERGNATRVILEAWAAQGEGCGAGTSPDMERVDGGRGGNKIISEQLTLLTMGLGLMAALLLSRLSWLPWA